MAAKYNLNYEAFGRQVLQSKEMQAHLHARADRVKAEFEATAPVYTGEFKGSARVESGVEVPEYGKGARAVGRVIVDDPLAMTKEFGHTDENGKHVEGAHTLTRALGAARD